MICFKSATAGSKSETRERQIDQCDYPVRHKVVVVKSDLFLLNRGRYDSSSDNEDKSSENVKHKNAEHAFSERVNEAAFLSPSH